MKVFFDTNVILDVLLDRHPFSTPASQLASLADTRVVSGLLSATTVTAIHYLSSKVLGRATANSQVGELLKVFRVAAVDGIVLERSLALGFEGFEDAVQHEAAVGVAADVIVTRNLRHFAGASVPVMAPDELLAALRLAE